MSQKIISFLLGYAFALALSILGLSLALLLFPSIGIEPFLLFVPIVALSAWYGGVWKSSVYALNGAYEMNP